MVIEKIESTLFTAGGLNLKIVDTLGRKTGNGNRLDAVYSKEYDSTKYNSISKLTNISINISTYLVFSVFNNELNTNEEVYFSIPHLSDVVDFLNGTIGQLIGDSDIYGDKDVNSQYRDLEFISPTLISGKQVKIIPYKIQIEDTNKFENGVIFFVNDEDHFAEVSLSNLISFYRIIESFTESSLLNTSLQLLIISKLYGGNDSISSVTSQTTKSFSRGSNFGSKSTSNFGSKSSNNKDFLKRRSITRKTEEVNEEPSVEDIIDEAETTSSKPVISKEKRKGISLSEIQQEAEKIDINDINIEDDIDF